MRNTRLKFLLAVAAALTSAAPALADAPASVPVQGVLFDSQGVPVDGEHRLTFILYDADIDGEVLYTDNYNNIDLDDGHFTVQLGMQESTPLDLALFREHGSVWLEITIDGNETISPRIPIGSVPYAGFAQYCGDATTVGGETAFTSEEQLTELLDDDYAPLSSVPDYSDFPDTQVTGGDMVVRYGDRALVMRQDETNSWISNKANFAGSNGSTGGTGLHLIGGGGVSIRVGDDGCCGSATVLSATPPGSIPSDASGTLTIEGIRLFQKPGNNGTVSCDTYCRDAGGSWLDVGPRGSCIGGKLHGDGSYVDCTTVPGLNNNVVCMCAAIP